MKKRPTISKEKVPPPTTPPGTKDPSKSDELQIQQGQNGEKGNTRDPEKTPDVKEASH